MTAYHIGTVYRVRRKSDGLFSTGTTHPKWRRVGKFFAGVSAIQHHLRWFLG